MNNVGVTSMQYLWLIPLLSTALWCSDPSATLYSKKCAQCHGMRAEKPAFNLSRPLNSLSAEELHTLLYGYRSNSYQGGGTMKPLMQKLVRDLSDQEIETLISYIKSI